MLIQLIFFVTAATQFFIGPLAIHSIYIYIYILFVKFVVFVYPKMSTWIQQFKMETIHVNLTSYITLKICKPYDERPLSKWNASKISLIIKKLKFVF